VRRDEPRDRVVEQLDGRRGRRGERGEVRGAHGGQWQGVRRYARQRHRRDGWIDHHLGRTGCLRPEAELKAGYGLARFRMSATVSSGTAALATGMSSTAYPAAIHAASPPYSGRTRLKPLFMSSRAACAAEASFGQAQ